MEIVGIPLKAVVSLFDRGRGGVFGCSVLLLYLRGYFR